MIGGRLLSAYAPLEPRWSFSDFLAAFLRQLLRPGEQVVQEGQAGVVHVLRDLGQQVLQVFVDLQLVRLGRFHQAVDHCAGLGTVDGVDDVPVGPANGEGTDRTLCCRVVDGNFAVFQEYFQVFLLVQAVFQGIPRLLAQDRGRLLFFYPCEVSLHEWQNLLLAALFSFFCCLVFQAQPLPCRSLRSAPVLCGQLFQMRIPYPHP